jgi:hypothetical protein
MKQGRESGSEKSKRKNMAERGQGWLTKVRRKKGYVWLHHFYVTRNVDGRRVETTRTIGSVSKFPYKSNGWAEVVRRNQGGHFGSNDDCGIG